MCISNKVCTNRVLLCVGRCACGVSMYINKKFTNRVCIVYMFSGVCVCILNSDPRIVFFQTLIFFPVTFLAFIQKKVFCKSI